MIRAGQTNDVFASLTVLKHWKIVFNQAQYLFNQAQYFFGKLKINLGSNVIFHSEVFVPDFK